MFQTPQTQNLFSVFAPAVNHRSSQLLGIVFRSKISLLKSINNGNHNLKNRSTITHTHTHVWVYSGTVLHVQVVQYKPNLFWQPVWLKRWGPRSFPGERVLIFSLKACQQGNVPGSLVNYINALILSYYPTHELPIFNRGTDEGLITFPTISFIGAALCPPFTRSLISHVPVCSMLCHAQNG